MNTTTVVSLDDKIQRSKGRSALEAADRPEDEHSNFYSGLVTFPDADFDIEFTMKGEHEFMVAGERHERLEIETAIVFALARHPGCLFEFVAKGEGGSGELAGRILLPTKAADGATTLTEVGTLTFSS